MRPISPHPIKKGELGVKRPSADRLLELASSPEQLLKDYDPQGQLGSDRVPACTGSNIASIEIFDLDSHLRLIEFTFTVECRFIDGRKGLVP